MPIFRLFIALGLTIAAVALPVHAAEPHWIHVASGHFLLLTDGDEKQGREVAVRFEQMRAVFGQLLMRTRVNMPLPIDIIALKSDDEYANAAPSPQGKPVFEASFFVAGEDREFYVLDLAEADNWRAISHEFARMLLNYNYPPTRAWFDEGFAEYFASLHLDNKQMQIGEDPESNPAVRQSVLGKPAYTGNPRQPLVDLLNQSPWLTLSALFAAKPESAAAPGSNRQTLFYAQSWIVMHYLINKNKLAETGTYFGLVQNDKLPVEDAIQKAFGMTSAQLDQAVKDYFHSVAPLLQVAAGKAPGGAMAPTAAPVAFDDVGISTTDVPETSARASVAEMDLRLPERHDQARQLLDTIAGQPTTDNAVARRGLGWDHLAKGEFDLATEEFTTAEEMDNRDAWPRYYMALTRYREAQSTGQQIRGLANMMQDLHVVLEVKPECAQAYYMLGWAQRAGGSIHAAMDSVRAAIRLAPRNQSYLLEMARVYLAAKDWDAATALLQQLSTSSDAQVATAAHNDLQDLPYLMKYGVAPVRAASAPAAAPAVAPATAKPAVPVATAQPVSKPAGTPAPTAQPVSKAANSTARAAVDVDNQELEAPSEAQIDRRPIHYLKGKLISVDCSQPPAAVLTFSSGVKTLKLKTPDYKSLTLIGADTFSCAWANRQVEVNYKAVGSEGGDLVSLEVR
ncbi:MAG: tetratricopeptide repeat protein [Terriglobales bacterium]